MSPIGKYEPILRIAELGSLTRAAESLGYSPVQFKPPHRQSGKGTGGKAFPPGTARGPPPQRERNCWASWRRSRPRRTNFGWQPPPSRAARCASALCPASLPPGCPRCWSSFTPNFPHRRPTGGADGHDELLTCLQREEVDCTFMSATTAPPGPPPLCGGTNTWWWSPETIPLAQQPSVGMEALYPYPFLPSTGRAETSPLARLYHRLSPPGAAHRPPLHRRRGAAAGGLGVWVYHLLPADFGGLPPPSG